jgi:hypothetical protein
MGPTSESIYAFAGYSAALDREEHAAARYRAALEDGERLLSSHGAATARR